MELLLFLLGFLCSFLFFLFGISVVTWNETKQPAPGIIALVSGVLCIITATVIFVLILFLKYI